MRVKTMTLQMLYCMSYLIQNDSAVIIQISKKNEQSHLMQNDSKKHDNLHGHLWWGRSCTQSNTISWKETDNVNIMQISSSQTQFQLWASLHNGQNTDIKLNRAISIIKTIIVYFACGTLK